MCKKKKSTVTAAVAAATDIAHFLAMRALGLQNSNVVQSYVYLYIFRIFRAEFND